MWRPVQRLLKEIVMTTTSEPKHNGMTELALYFLRLGLLGFRGPVALVGQIERELVNDKKWLTKAQMRESIAICQSLPGPLAIQVGIYIAWLRCGFLSAVPELKGDCPVGGGLSCWLKAASRPLRKQLTG